MELRFDLAINSENFKIFLQSMPFSEARIGDLCPKIEAIEVFAAAENCFASELLENVWVGHHARDARQ